MCYLLCSVAAWPFRIFFFEHGKLVPVQQYVTCAQACAFTCAYVGRVLYSKLWLLGVPIKQCSVSLFPLLSSTGLPLGFHFTSTESLISV